MEMAREEHKAPAASPLQENHQQGCFTSAVPSRVAAADFSEHAAAVGNLWNQSVEKEYIDIREALEADSSNFGSDASDAVGSVSGSSGDEATAEEEEGVTEDICADDLMDTSEPCENSFPVASCHALPTYTAFDPILASSCDVAGSDCSAAHSTHSVSFEEGLTLRTALEITLEGARDAICCVSVGACGVCEEAFPANIQSYVDQAVVLAALGSCDDACRVYALPSTAPPELANTSVNSTSSARDSSAVIGSRSCQRGATRRQKMAAAATLREGQETVSAAAFSFDNKLLACGCFDGVVRVYRPRVTEASKGAKVPWAPLSWGLAKSQRLSTQGGKVDAATTAEPEMDGSVKQPVGRPELQGMVPEAATSFSDKRGDNGGVENVGVSVDLAEELRGCTADVVDVSFHPRGYALLVAAADQTAWVWLLPPSIVKDSGPKAPESRRAVALAVFAAAAPLTCCCFSSAGREGMVGAADGTVSVFSAKSGALLYAIKHPGIAHSMRQRHQEQQKEGCSVVTLRLSNLSNQLPSARKGSAVGAHSEKRLAGTNDSRFVSAGPGVCLSESERISDAKAVMNEREQQEEVLLGVGYEDGWVALIRAEGGEVIFATQGHGDKAVESVSFIKLIAGHRAPSARTAAERYGYGSCQLFASGGLDGRVVIWDVAHKCIRACIVAAYTAPAAAFVNCLENTAVEHQVTAAVGVTRLLVLQGSRVNLCVKHSGIEHSEARPEVEWLAQQHHIHQFQAQQQLRREAALICAGCTDGRLILADIRTGQVLLQWQAHVGAVMDMTIVPVTGDVAVPERRAFAESIVDPAATGGNTGAGLPQHHQGNSQCSCCWRILSAGDDGLGKVWCIFISSNNEAPTHLCARRCL